MVDLARLNWRDYEVDGVAASGKHKPLKSKIRQWGTWVESVINAFMSNGGLVYATRALLYADLLHGANTSAWVVSDSTAAYNGIYQKSGISGVGAWTRIADLPYSFISCADAGAGTANAIIATSSIPAPSTAGAALFLCNIYEANSGAVTLALNGAVAKPVITNSGNALVSGYLVAGMQVMFIDDGTSWRLVSDVASAAIQAAAEAAQAAAELAAANAALYDGVWFDTVALLLADVTKTYGNTATGDYFRTRAEGFSFKVAASGASDHHVVNAGGVKLYVMPLEAGYPAQAFGTIGDGVADDSAAMLMAWNTAVAAGAFLDLGAGKTYLLSTWNAAGVAFASPKIRGNGATIKGPSGGAGIFAKPSGVPSITGVTFDRWARVFVRLLADGGTITGGHISFNTFTTSDAPIDFECPTAALKIVGNTITGGVSQTAIRIGTNDDSLETGWIDTVIEGNTITGRSTTGTTGNLVILVYSQYGKIVGNTIRNMRSVNAECIGIYTKCRWSLVANNIVEDIKSTGASGAFEDVVGISLKGDSRANASVSPGGYKNTCIGNVVKTIGTQASHGMGIRSQGQENIIDGNVIEDVGEFGIYSDDLGTIGSVITGNTIRGYNILGVDGIVAAGVAYGAIISNNQIIDFSRSIRLDGGATSMFNPIISGNFCFSNIASSYGVHLAAGTVRDAMVKDNTIQLASGTLFVFDSYNHTEATISDNDLFISAAVGCTLLSGTVPTGLRMNNNRGFKTRNGGVASIATGAGVAVNHGLYTTPQGVLTSLVNNVANWSSSTTYTSTQITLLHNAGTTQSVNWIAWTAEDVA